MNSAAIDSWFYTPWDSFVSNESNPRTITEEQLAKLVRSIADFPTMLQKRPIVCVTERSSDAGNLGNGTTVVLAARYLPLGGNMRTKAGPHALRLLKDEATKCEDNEMLNSILERIRVLEKGCPVILADEWTPMERDEFVIKDNLAFGEWNWDMLANDWDTEKLLDWGMTIPGFKLEDPAEVDEDDFDGKVPVVPKTVLGDRYELNGHVLQCADSTDSEAVARLLDKLRPDLVFTDPPYNVAFNGRSGKFKTILNDDLPAEDFTRFIDEWLQTFRAFEPRTYYICCNWAFYGQLQSALSPKACIVWAKNVFGMGRGYRHQHEFILFDGFIKPDITNESDLWQIKKDHQYKHPTQKPVELAARAIKNSTTTKDVVLDYFGGSGSTLLACEQLDRACRMQELDPGYCDLIVMRWVRYMRDKGKSYTVRRNGEDITAEEWMYA